MHEWKRIIIHCSDSEFGSASEIRGWHINGNGWSDIGYHYVINNGSIKTSFYLESFNGSLEIGRIIDGDKFAEENEKGAHAYGFNSDSIGICLIGKDRFTPKQMGVLFSLVFDLMQAFNIEVENVIGHYELDARKSCPNINMKELRSMLNILR